MAMDLEEFVAEDLWLLIAIVTVVLTSLVGLFGLELLAGAISIVGFILLTPVFLFWGEEIAEWLFDADESVATAADEDDPLEELKRRYAEGEIDTEEFEHRLERLVEVENVPPGRLPAGTRAGTSSDRSGRNEASRSETDTDRSTVDDSPEPEPEREPER